METTKMKIEYRKQVDSETAPWQLLTNMDELLWNGVYALRVAHDDGSHNLPFRFGSDETVTIVVKDHAHEGMLENGRTVVQTITRVDRTTGNVYLYTRTRYNAGGTHVWSYWALAGEGNVALESPKASKSSLGSVIVGDGLVVDADGKVSLAAGAVGKKQLATGVVAKIDSMGDKLQHAASFAVNDGVALHIGALVENNTPYSGTNYRAYTDKLLSNGEHLIVNEGYSISTYKIFDGEQEISFVANLDLKQITLDGEHLNYQLEFKKDDTTAFASSELPVVIKYFQRNLIAWSANSHIDNYIAPGTYNIRGDRTNLADGLPIYNTGSFSARLTVLASNNCVTQVLTLLNVGGGDSNVYTRTRQGSNWGTWGKLQQNVEVGETTSLDAYIDNGIYSGVYTNGSTLFETFVMVVINNYAVAAATGTARNITQLKYAVDTNGTFCYHVRNGQGADTVEWGAWSDLDAVTTDRIQDGAVTAQKLSDDVRENIEQIDSIESELLDVNGFYISTSFQVPVQSNINTVGNIEFPARIKNGTHLYINYTQNYTPGDKGIRLYINSALPTNLVTPKRNGFVLINQSCDKIIVATDCSVEGTLDIIVSKENIVVESKREIKILSIGNSFSQDAFCYMPYILHNIAPDIKLTLGIAYYSGASLQQHLQLMDEESASYKLDKWTWEIYRWNAVSEQTLQQCLENEAWDIVVFQQSSSFSGDYLTVSPYLNRLIKRVGETLIKPAKFAWLLTPSNKTDFAESESFYNSISDVAEQVLQETPIDMLFPCGTAIQNARHTSLQALGDAGNLLHTSLHLQEGIPCLIEAYVAAMVIARSAGNNVCSVYGEPSIVDAGWLNAKFIPGIHGSPVGSTAENCRIAQIAAISAMKKPFDITDISYVDEI